MGLGLRGEEILVWLRSDAYTVQASEEARARAGSPSSFLYNPPLVEGQVLRLHDMTDGEYSILWYDPQAAKWLNAASATARDGLLVIDVPTFRRDLAAKVILRQ